MQDSVFTRIIKGEIPAHTIYEDDDTLALLDIHPSVTGHTLVVPKQQVPFLWDLEPESYERLMAVVHKLGAHLRQSLDVPYVGVKVVGVDVPHAHVHLIPFSSVDEYRREGDMGNEPDHETLAALARRLTLETN